MQFPQSAAQDPVVTDSRVGLELAAAPLTLETTDPSEFEVALRPWELLCRPIDAGDFRHRVTLFVGDQLLLYHEPLFPLFLMEKYFPVNTNSANTTSPGT